MIKRGLIFGVVLGILLVCLNPVLGDFELSKINESYSIDLVYGASEPIGGWINISLQNEPVNSVLSAFDSNISIKDFLDENNADYSCFPNDCEPAYSSAGDGKNSRQFSINYWENKLFGIKLTGQITGIDSFYFNVSTNAGKSCLNPIRIDVLDDGIMEWTADEVSDDTCYMKNPYGCWDVDDYTGSESIIASDSYCEKINISSGKGFKIGADITGSGSAVFEMQISAGGEFAECEIPVSEQGEISCLTEFDNAVKDIQAEVCINRKDSGTNDYQIKYENVAPCGSAGGINYDFPIFAYPRKYFDVSNFIFNQDLIDEGETGIDLAGEIWNYVYSKYRGNCEPECIIPVKFYSGITQTDTISNLNLRYKKGITQSEKNIYDVVTSEVLISSDFQKLDLEKANLLVPDEIGNVSLVLNLGGEEILEKNINVRAVPIIKAISPQDVPALVDVKFVVFLDDKNNLTYVWDFGDETEKETTKTNKNTHMYQEIGNYELSVIVSNKFGNSTKTISVKAGSPKNYINDTINNYENKLNSIGTEIDKLAEWIKKEIKKKFDVDDLKSQINSQKSKYDAAFTDEDYVKIMSDLLGLNIPDSFGVSYDVPFSDMLLSPEQINLDALESFGAGGVSGGKENYANAVTNWFEDNINMKIESKTYALYYDNEGENLCSYVKVVLNPNQDLGDVYFLVNGDADKIKFNGDYSVKDFEGKSSGIIFSDLSETKTIEFLYPKLIEIGKFPVYVSPEFKNLELEPEVGVCNFNKKCEKNLGENYKNCRSDCKPAGKTILYILLLLFAGFVIYIILQEWYKRHYESHLFKNRNQLFNLVNFMSNSFNQGIEKSKIFEKLKKLGWDNEQLNYAWNKLMSKRTGMWEIPLFKWIEKRQVQREIKKRKNLSVNRQIPKFNKRF